MKGNWEDITVRCYCGGYVRFYYNGKTKKRCPFCDRVWRLRDIIVKNKGFQRGWIDEDSNTER